MTQDLPAAKLAIFLEVFCMKKKREECLAHDICFKVCFHTRSIDPPTFNSGFWGGSSFWGKSWGETFFPALKIRGGRKSISSRILEEFMDAFQDVSSSYAVISNETYMKMVTVTNSKAKA